MFGVFAAVTVLVSWAQTSAVPSYKQLRSGKFLAFDSDDAFLDLLDEMQDPLPVPESSDGPVVYQSAEAFEPKPRPTKKKQPAKNDFYQGEKEKIPAGKPGSANAEPDEPVTEDGLFFFGGQRYRYRNPNPIGAPSLLPGNKTEEIKIFWSSVGDAIENVPFLPIQVNVPDVLGAVAQFLSNSIPFVDRIRNPNEPRPIPKPVPTFSGAYDRIDRDDQDFHYGRTGESSSAEETAEPGEKKREESEATGTSKRIFKRPVRPLRPLPTSTEDLVKIWHGSQSEGSAKIKNMPITRKKFHVADREFFNFKNSDISNSPIMILNMPSRPMMYYKIKHRHVSGGEAQTTTEIPVRPTETQPRPPQNSTAQISRRRKLRKQNKKPGKKDTRRVKQNQKKKL